jgi:hypothetical protein
MFGKLLASEETTAALVLALSGTIMVLVAKGDGPLSSRRLVSGALSNPVPRLSPGPRREARVRARPSAFAA